MVGRNLQLFYTACIKRFTSAAAAHGGIIAIGTTGG